MALILEVPCFWIVGHTIVEGVFQVVQVLLSFALRQVTNVDVEHATFWSTRDPVDNQGVFHHTKLVGGLDSLVQPADCVTGFRISQA
ncbi:hypothetical protein D3C80_1631610 [compost metagenome]